MNQSEARESILVVDDSEDTLDLIRRHLEGSGHTVLLAPGPAEAMELLARTAVDLVITDLKMPGISGLELVRHVRENLKDTEVLIVTGYPSVESAVEAMREGAADYLPKPFTASELRAAVNRVLERLRARRAVGASAGERAEQYPGFIAASAAMRPVLRWIGEQVPRMDPVLIEGEPGTGRRTVARLLHHLGPGKGRAFFEIHCALPFSSEEVAAAPSLPGTLYLHEASALPCSMQDRIAERFLSAPRPASSERTRLVLSSSTGEFGSRPARTDREAPGASDGRFRLGEGLPRIKLPSLRERGEDLLPLLQSLGRRTAEQLSLPAPEFTDRAVEALRLHPWPGNLSELWRTVRRSLQSCQGRAIDAPDLPPYMRFSAHAGSRPDRSLAAIEAAYIQEVLASVKGNRSRAAEVLRIDRKTLRDKLRRG